MELAAFLCRGRTIESQYLPQDLVPAPRLPAADAAAAEALASLVLDEQVAALVRRLIEAALQRSDNNKAAAARLLGASERTLWYKIKKYGR